MSESEYENVSTLEAQERDYQKIIERRKFTEGLDRNELLHRINTPREAKKAKQ